jgi:hypothetical protein
VNMLLVLGNEQTNTRRAFLLESNGARRAGDHLIPEATTALGGVAPKLVEAGDDRAAEVEKLTSIFNSRGCGRT